MPTRPKILQSKVVATSRLFKVEELQLEFSNGVERTYERLVSQGQGAVMIVAVNEQEELVLIREYAGGFHDYVLTFPKGLIDPGEDALTAANRELKEEAGYGAHQLELIARLSLAPNYMGHKMDVVLARGLYPCKLEGDEPEPLEVVLHPLEDWHKLISNIDFHEARSLAALFLTREKLFNEQKQNQELNGA